MIELTRLNDEKFLINSDLIEIVDANPDTVITLINEHKFVVKEDMAPSRSTNKCKEKRGIK